MSKPDPQYVLVWHLCPRGTNDAVLARVERELGKELAEWNLPHVLHRAGATVGDTADPVHHQSKNQQLPLADSHSCVLLLHGDAEEVSHRLDIRKDDALLLAAMRTVHGLAPRAGHLVIAPVETRLTKEQREEFAREARKRAEVAPAEQWLTEIILCLHRNEVRRELDKVVQVVPANSRGWRTAERFFLLLGWVVMLAWGHSLGRQSKTESVRVETVEKEVSVPVALRTAAVRFKDCDRWYDSILIGADDTGSFWLCPIPDIVDESNPWQDGPPWRPRTESDRKKGLPDFLNIDTVVLTDFLPVGAQAPALAKVGCVAHMIDFFVLRLDSEGALSTPARYVNLRPLTGAGVRLSAKRPDAVARLKKLFPELDTTLPK